MVRINSQRVESDIYHASRLGQLIVVRSHKLMAYGINASYSKDADFDLPGFVRYQDDLGPLDDELRLSFQEMFRSWIAGAGLKDMLEGVAASLDGMYAVLMRTKGTLEGRPQKPVEKQIKAFRKRGVSEKLSDLKRDFQIEIDTQEHLKTIVKARNALTHRLGVVGDTDCDEGTNHLTITWRSIDLTVIKSDGTEIPITWRTEGSIPGDAGDKLRHGTKTDALQFKHGEEISIPPRVLEEIAVMMRFSIAKLHQHSIHWLLDREIPVNRGVRIEDPTVDLEITLSEPEGEWQWTPHHDQS